AKRNAAAELRVKDRLAAIAKERAALQTVLAAEFPDYAALSSPAPLTAVDIQGLLRGDEALVAFAAVEKQSYVLALTRDAFAWKEAPLGAAMLAEKVADFRHGLDVEALRKSAASGKPELFDLGLAHELYAALLAPVDELIKEKRHLIVV